MSKRSKQSQSIEDVHDLDYNHEAEELLVAALFARPDTAHIAKEAGIGPSHFGDRDRREVYKVTQHLLLTDDPIIFASVRDYLDRQGVELNSPDRLEQWSNVGWMADERVEWAIKEVVNRHSQRMLNRVLGKSIANGAKANGNLPEVAHSNLAEITRATQAASLGMSEDDKFLLAQDADDEGNAECLRYLYGDKFLYVDALGWLTYNGRYWEGSIAEHILERDAAKMLKRRRILAAKTDSEKLIRAAKPSRSNVRNAIGQFRSMVVDDIANFDDDPDMLNCYNGVVDLRTGEITSHDASQRFTYCVNTEYDPGTDDSEWVKWLYSAIVPRDYKGDEAAYVALLEWLQIAVGYSITGHTIEDCLFYIYGPGRAGKGLFQHTIATLIGKPLAAAVDFDTFTAKRGGDSQNFDLAPLRPSRIVNAGESNHHNMVNVKTLKALTGNEDIYCAFKGKTHFSYKPAFKIWLSSNHPINTGAIGANDDALWARLRVIHFPNSYIGKEDRTLRQRLSSHLPGILAWAVHGAMEWYKRVEDDDVGMTPPKIVQDTTQAHRDENDSVQQFIDERCVVGDELIAQGRLMTSEYIDWCKESNISPLGSRTFGEVMRGKGFTKKNARLSMGTKMCWHGIGLQVTADF